MDFRFKELIENGFNDVILEVRLERMKFIDRECICG